jgi:hypothetical protein
MPARHHLLAASLLIAAGTALAQPGGTQAQPGAGSPGTDTPATEAPRPPAMAQPGTSPASPGTQPGTGTTTGQPGSAGVAQPGTASPGTGIPSTEAPRPGMGQPGTSPGTATTPGSAAGTAMTGSASPRFVSELQTAHYLGSRLDGADVYDSANEKIADVEDIIVSDQGQVVAVVLSYGGVAGIGQTYVAVAPSQLRMRKVSDSETRVETSMTADQLREAPKFSYSARSR